MKKTLLFGFLASLVASVVVADAVVRADNGGLDQPSISHSAFEVQPLRLPSNETPPAVSRGAGAYDDVAARPTAAIEDIDAFAGARPLGTELVADLIARSRSAQPMVVITSSGGTIELIDMGTVR